MKRFNKLTTALIVLVGIGGMVSLHAAPDAAEIWKKNCQKCHAPDGSGKTKMGERLKLKDYTDAKVQAEFKDEDLIKATKEGIKEGDKEKMKAYGPVLTDEEITSVVAYIRGFKK